MDIIGALSHKVGLWKIRVRGLLSFVNSVREKAVTFIKFEENLRKAWGR